MLNDVGGVPVVSTGSGYGDGSGSWLGMLLVIALLGGRGFGFGGHGDEQHDRAAEKQLDCLDNAVNSRFNELQNQIDFNANAAFQRDLSDKICSTNTNIDRTNYDTNRNIDGIRFQGERDTCAIIEAINRSSQRQIDWLSCNELKEASSRIAALEAEKNKLEIIAAMKPREAVPAYLQPSPYQPYYPTNGFGLGFNQGNCGAAFA